MRLIDLEDEILKKRLFMYQHEGGLSAKQAIRLFTNQPTAQAIPIEWLMKWEKEHTWEYESYFREIGKYPIECAIEDWRKESEDKE